MNSSLLRLQIRLLLTALAAALAVSVAAAKDPPRPAKTPLIHTGDLIFPPWDTDDQTDIACIYALEELDLRAVILDSPQPANDGDQYEPAFGLITQMNWLTGRWVPAAAGPPRGLKSPSDDGAHFASQEQAGIRLLIDQLEKAEQPVFVSVVGSSRTVTAAFNRRPELFREKVRAVLLCAGIVHRVKGDRLDANTRFDLHAFVGLMRSGLPIWWFPPGPVPRAAPGLTIDPETEPDAARREAIRHHSKFVTPYGRLLENLPGPLHAWFVIGFSGNQRGELIRPLYEKWTAATWWGVISKAESACSSPPLFLLAAERRLARTEKGWRFLKPGDPRSKTVEEFPWSLTPVDVRTDDDGHTEWKPAERGHIRLFTHESVDGIRADTKYSQAMTEALNALFREDLLPKDAILAPVPAKTK